MYISEMKKRCSKCGNEKDVDEFYTAKSNKDGKQNVCKLCWCEIVYKRKKANWATIYEKQKVYVEKNKERIAAMKRKCYLNTTKKYKEENPEEANKKSRKYSEAQRRNLTDGYLRGKLIGRGWPKDILTKELLSFIRSRIKFKRYAKNKNIKD